MAQTLYFHVGSGRCGTTTLQVLLSKKQMITLLENFGIHYSTTLFTAVRDASAVPYFPVVAETWKAIADAEVGKLLNPASKGILITQENLFSGRFETGSVNHPAESAEVISILASGMPVKILMIVRRQDTLIESLYNQVLKRMETRTFETFVDEFPFENIHWQRIADDYASAFGKDNVTVIPFESRVLSSKGQGSYINAFFSAMGVPTDDKIVKLAGVSNPSMAPRTMEVQRIANMYLTEAEARALAEVFMTHMPKAPGEPYTLMTEDMRQKLIDRYKDSNADLFARYLPGYDPAYYVGA